jgi:hypothetical protein
LSFVIDETARELGVYPMEAKIAILIFVALGALAVVALVICVPIGVYLLKTSVRGSELNQEVERIKSTESLSKMLSFLLAIGFLMYVLATIESIKWLVSFKSLDQDAVPELLDMYLGLEGLLFLVCGIVFLVWQYLSQRNLLVSGKKLVNTPGWVIGNYFIPIYNLFAPFGAMKELFVKSVKDQTHSYMVAVWWLMFLAQQFASTYYSSSVEGGIESLYSASVALAIGQAAGAISIAAAIYLVNKISDEQEDLLT